MAEIVPLQGLKPVALEADPDLVKQAEIILQKCKDGEITGMIVVTNARNDWTGTMRMGEMTYGMIGRLNEMIRNTLIALDD